MTSADIRRSLIDAGVLVPRPADRSLSPAVADSFADFLPIDAIGRRVAALSMARGLEHKDFRIEEVNASFVGRAA